MKFRVVIQIAVILSVLLLCTGIGVYSFLKLDYAEHRNDFNLYALVPQDAVAVVETNRMTALVDDINALACSRDDQFLYISDLFVYLKNYLHTLTNDIPHGLSTSMNNMLLSFHEPDTPADQVLYCNLGEGDEELVETFLTKYSSSRFPPKEFTYRGKLLRIYSLVDGRFLTTYFTREYLVLSFQKRLVEAVIDARADKRSLMQLPSFRAARGERRQHLASAIYLRQPQWGTWLEFDLRFNDTAIYCSGLAHQPDTTQTLVASLLRAPVIDGFPGKQLPATTIAYTHSGLVDTLQGPLPQVLQNPHWNEFLHRYAKGSVTTVLFTSADTLRTDPCLLIRIPLTHSAEAADRLWEMPSPAGKLIARIHRGALLLAQDRATLQEYIRSIAQAHQLDTRADYQQGIAALSPAYSYLTSVDVAALLAHPGLCPDWLPSFFLRHADFFCHFLLEIQITRTDGELLPNIVLLYKE